MDRLPPATFDALDSLAASIRGAMKRADRTGYEGRIDPAWADRISRKLASALRECDRARAAGAVIRRPPDSCTVEVLGSVPTPLPTEPAHAAASFPSWEQMWRGPR